MSRHWSLLIRGLTDAHEHFDDFTPAELYPAALAWMEQDGRDCVHEAITEQDFAYDALFRRQLPRFGRELVALKAAEPNTAEDAVWDIGIGLMIALVTYASRCALRAEWDYAKSESIDPREGLGELMAMRAEDARDRARDMMIEQERAA